MYAPLDTIGLPNLDGEVLNRSACTWTYFLMSVSTGAYPVLVAMTTASAFQNLHVYFLLRCQRIATRFFNGRLFSKRFIIEQFKSIYDYQKSVCNQQTQYKCMDDTHVKSMEYYDESPLTIEGRNLLTVQYPAYNSSVAVEMTV